MCPRGIKNGAKKEKTGGFFLFCFSSTPSDALVLFFCISEGKKRIKIKGTEAKQSIEMKRSKKKQKQKKPVLKSKSKKYSV